MINLIFNHFSATISCIGDGPNAFHVGHVEEAGQHAGTGSGQTGTPIGDFPAHHQFDAVAGVHLWNAESRGQSGPIEFLRIFAVGHYAAHHSAAVHLLSVPFGHCLRRNLEEFVSVPAASFGLVDIDRQSVTAASLHGVLIGRRSTRNRPPAYSFIHNVIKLKKEVVYVFNQWVWSVCDQF